HLVGRARVERLENALQIEQRHGYAPPVASAPPETRLPRPAKILGKTSAANTKPAVTSLRSFGSSPQRRASATISRNRSEPRTAPEIESPSPPVPTNACPRITLAKPQTIIPIPIWMSAK